WQQRFEPFAKGPAFIVRGGFGGGLHHSSIPSCYDPGRSLSRPGRYSLLATGHGLQARITHTARTEPSLPASGAPQPRRLPCAPSLLSSRSAPESPPPSPRTPPP